MKFSDKEKKILKIVGLLFFCIIYFNFYLRFQYGQIKGINSQISSLKKDAQDAIDLKESLNAVDSEINKLKTSMSDIRRIYPQEISHDTLLIGIKQIEEYAGIRITSISIDDLKGLDINITQGNKILGEKQQMVISDKKLQKVVDELGFNMLKAPVQNIDNGQVGIQGAAQGNSLTGDKKKKVEKFIDGKGYSMDVNLGAKASYSGLKKFIGAIEALRNKVVFKKIDVNRNADDSVSANITLSFYGIKDLVSKVSESVVPVQIGENNLFKPYTGYDLKSVTATSYFQNLKDENLYLVADFTSRVLPYGKGMSPQALTISAKNVVLVNSIGGGVVFGDDESQEKAFLDLEEKDGKYMFKMKTGSDSYPDKKYEKMTEFKPVGDRLLFLVDATIRKSLTDNSSVIFQISNKTSKILEVVILNDDKVKPRVSINKNSGNIELRN